MLKNTTTQTKNKIGVRKEIIEEHGKTTIIIRLQII